MSPDPAPFIWLTVHTGAHTYRWQVARGSNLRRVLMARGLSPYGTFTQRLNCGGRGLCATCGVRVNGHAPAPRHWHDRAAAAFGYPRLACQMTLEADTAVTLIPGKRVWGQWLPQKRTPGE